MIYVSAAPFAAQLAAGATQTVQLGTYEVSPATGVGVQRVVLVPPAGFATVNGVATNNWTLNVRQVRAGAVVSTFASVTGNVGVNLVAETPVNVPVTSQPVLQPDDVIDAQLVQNGTGVAVGAGLAVEVNVA